MTATFGAVDLASGSVIVSTDEIELAKRGGLIAATDGRQHEITVTVTPGRNGWVNVRVSSTTDWGRPMDFGFLPAGKQSRWSYNTRPPQIVVDAMKTIRNAVKTLAPVAASPAAVTSRRANDERYIVIGDQIIEME